MTIKELTLKNFKSVKDQTIQLEPLTVLTGLNGSGKSSILQAISLIKQSIDLNQIGNQLVLNGPWIKLGRAEDVLFEGADSELISINIEVDGKKNSWLADATPNLDTLDASFEGDLHSLKTGLQNFQFIQADRLTPAVRYQQATSADQELGRLGPNGEYTVDYLSRNGNMKISSSRCYPESRLRSEEEKDLMQTIAPTDRLWDVTSAWLQQLSPGVRPIARVIDITSATSLRFEYTGLSREAKSREHKPTNVGFGLTYSLPIIVSCLSAPAGAVLLLENPEAHLHPRGQSALGLLLSLCANDGVNIIVETHSDHLLNGIRLAAKRKDILASDVAVHFFTRDIATGLTTCQSPNLLDNGRFDDLPSGFFDEWGNALDELLGE